MFQRTVISIILCAVNLNTSSLADDELQNCFLGVHCLTKPHFDCEVRQVQHIGGCSRWRNVSQNYEGHFSNLKTSIAPTKPGNRNMRYITAVWNVFQDTGQRYSLVCITSGTKRGRIVKSQETCYAVRAKVKTKGYVQFSLKCLDVDRRRGMAKVWNGVEKDDLCLNKKTGRLKKRALQRTRQKCVKREPRFRTVTPKILNVSIYLRNNMYRYCSVWLMDTDLNTYLTKKSIEAKSEEISASFRKMKDGRYQVMIECQSGKGRGETPCRSLSMLNTLVFTEPDFGEPKTTQKDSKEPETTSKPRMNKTEPTYLTLVLVIALVIVCALIITLLIGIGKVRSCGRKNRQQPSTEQNDECSIPLRRLDSSDSYSLNGKIRLLVITDYSERIGLSLCKFLDTHPEIRTACFEQDTENAREDFGEWMKNCFRNTDVVLIVLTEAFIQNCLQSVEGRASGLALYPCHMVKNLEGFLNSPNNQRDKPITLTVELIDRCDQSFPLDTFREYFYMLDSGMTYTITKQVLNDRVVEFHNQIHHLLETIQKVSDRKPAHVPNFLTSQEAHHFLISVKELVERNQQT